MNMMKRPKIHFMLLMGSFVVALVFRFIRLGGLPLSNMEADIALQALAVSRGLETQFGPYMAYVGLTGLDFFIFNAGNFMARFWPAFFGALIVFVPFLFRDRIGLWPATISSIFLAISPEMVGYSRIIGSPMMAFVCLLLALGFLLNRKPVLTGVAMALGLMSGPSFWIGGVILGSSFLFSKWFLKGFDGFAVSVITEKRDFLKHAGLSFFATLLVLGTSFFMAPKGISGIFSGLFAFVSGFVSPYPGPFLLLPLALIAYAAPAVIFGIWGSVRGMIVRNATDMFLLVWVVLGLAFVLLYPGHRPAGFIWVTLPLWILSARVSFFAWRFPESSRFVMAVTAVLVVVFSAFMLMAMRSLVNLTGTQSQELNVMIALVGGVVLLVAMILLVSYGWSEDVAMAGLLMGLAIVFCAGLISVSVNATGLAPDTSYELWYPEQAYLSPDWMMISIDRIIGWNASGGTPVEIAVSDYKTPGMQWVLRDYDPVHFEPYLVHQSQPGLIITDAREIPEISNSYRGQGLVWSREVLWGEMSPFQYLKWLVTRDAPTAANQIILWVRTDLMPDSQFSQ
jgi:hypothetical protein